MPELHGTSQRQVNVLQQKPLCHPDFTTQPAHIFIPSTYMSSTTASSLFAVAGEMKRHKKHPGQLKTLLMR
eukprot:scaffold215451_cov15-Tisochrysis_lutea.AAC.1